MKKRIFTVSLLAALLLSGCGSTRDMEISITVPKNSELDYYWSDEQISPGKNKLTFETSAGTPDSKVAIQTIEVENDMIYLPSLISPNTPTTFKAEKGGWYKIGMMFENPTDEDVTYTVTVKDIEIRIEENSNPD